MAIPNRFGDNNDPQGQTEERGPTQMQALLAYVMRDVRHGREDRDTKHAQRWKEYTRLWRGYHTDADKNNDSERSRLIAPALQQAVEMTVAEMEEAVFGRTAWFDLTDDIADENRDDAVQYRDQLLEDFELDGVPDAISKCFLMGAIYGTGIAKINVAQIDEMFMEDGQAVRTPRISVRAECVRPDQFVIDPAATSVDEAKYVAHEMVRPIHAIREKIAAGTYRDVPVYAWTGESADTDGTGAHSTVRAEDSAVLITEYFGKVPRSMIPNASPGESRMVEAIVTVANESQILRAVESPFTMKDRPIVAYQHDTVPGEFWGRGVCEKGYNPQKALDAELRARIDTLALITAPMMGADVNRLHGKHDMRVRPGKTILTRGRPSEVYEPITFGNPGILAHTFQHSGDLERMVQMGTGAMDSATPVGVNARNETASGISQLQAGFIKRSKRTMQNVERQFLDHLIRRSLWRYMQFDPARYQVDFKFKVNATMGIMAKEVENAQLTNMLGFLTPDDPARAIVIQAIFENSASANKAQLKEALAQMNRPPSPEEQAQQQRMQELQMATIEAQARKEAAQAEKEAALARKAEADALLAREKARHTRIEADLEDDLVDIQAANAVTAAEKARATREQNAVAAARVRVESQRGGNDNGRDSS